MIKFLELKVDTNGGITVEYTENGETKTNQCLKKFPKESQSFVEYVNDEFDRDREYDTLDDMVVDIAYLGTLFLYDPDDDDDDEDIKCFSFKSVEHTQDGMILHYQEDEGEGTINLTAQLDGFKDLKEEKYDGLVDHLNSNKTMENGMYDCLLFLLIAVATVSARYLSNITDGDEMEAVQNEIVKAFETINAEG